jgi:glycosyltransferase involved in cell wall biosynthesis
MALRLTSTSLADEKPQAPASARPETVGAAVQALAARAPLALLRRAYDEYRSLFDEATAFEDPNRRYQARKLLVEQGFTASAQVPAAQAAEILAAVAAAAVAALELEPAEPVLVNYAGVAFYELWSLDAARALFTAAGRLDPSLPHVRRNLAECTRRRRAGAAPHRPRHGVSPELIRRAKRVAERARPATGLTLSLCMIVRDEEEMLPQCLEAVAPVVDEIVIVDTGSKDRTIEIARSFGARVIEREWTGSFADARNASFDAATGDWLLYLDADEVLVSEDADRLRALTGHTWREAFYFVETSFTGSEEDGTAVSSSALRLFRSRPEYRFSGRLHEQIAQHLPGYLPERLEPTTIRIEHYGYLGVVRDAKEKSRRNIELLEAQKAESPPSPFLHFNLGSEYFALGDSRSALSEFRQAWSMIEAEGTDATREFTASLVVRLVKALRENGHHDEALAFAAESLERFPGFTDLVFEQGIIATSMKDDDAAVAHFTRCIEMGDAPARYTALVGCGTYLPRIALAEIQLRRNEPEPALDLLRWCAGRFPRYAGIVLPYASAILRSGGSPEETVAEIEARVANLGPAGRFMLGTALFEAGAGGPAEHQFRLVLESQPHSGPARAALAEALLYQRRYEEAAAEAAQMDADNPLVVVALRSELFGRIAGGDLDGARSALDRATAAGLPTAELALFRGWVGLRGGEPVTGVLPAEAIGLLAAILESLLRVQDFESFETVLPLVAASELPPREQRELLGSIYLRRGYLRSAAREWMAVAGDAPDVRALLGLARVALGNAQPDTARAFAAEALALDPSCQEAAAIVAAYQPAVVA